MPPRDLRVLTFDRSRRLSAGDGLVGIEEYRVDCCSRSAYSELAELDQGYNKLCSVSDHIQHVGVEIQ